MYSLQIITSTYEEYTAYDLELLFGGFRSMTLGRTLWVIILLKLFVMFFILKMFFFPDFLRDHPTDDDKGTYVGNELIERAIPGKSTDF